MIENDEQLLAKAKALDPTALREIHQRYYESVTRYVRFKVGNRQTVEDLSGEVFVRVIESLRRGKSWQTSVKGWIMGIAHHVVVDYYRKRERMTEVKLIENLNTPHENNPSHQALLSDRNRQLMQAIDELTEDQRDVILLRFIHGGSIQEVAEATGKTTGAVKALQYRAVRALAEKVQHLSISV